MTFTPGDNPMGTDGFEFVEYAAPDPHALNGVFERMGFRAIARHRHKNVLLYRQGQINFIVNAEPDSFAQRFARLHGPSICDQSLGFSYATQAAKGPYAMFDNVTAIFSATPVITRTATYIYACTEWIEDAFQGKELLLEIYSRLLNPTSVSLANFIVEIEAGPYANEYSLTHIKVISSQSQSSGRMIKRPCLAWRLGAA